MKRSFLSSCIFFLAVMPARLLFIILMAGGLSGVETSFAGDNCIPAKPSPPHLVNNFSKEFPNFLSADEAAQLEQKLVAFNDSTSNQIVIVIVDDLCGYDANEFATRLGEQWKVGQQKFDNGLVILVKPTGGEGQRDLYIAQGYGLEGIIPDITCKQIVDNEIIPRFKEGNYYYALDAATDVLMSLAKKEYSSDEYARPNNSDGRIPVIYFFAAFFFILIIFLRIIGKKGGTTISNGRTYYGGGWSSWGGGGFGGGSSGGGGFGGFGGGGFGGGGAGGKW